MRHLSCLPLLVAAALLPALPALARAPGVVTDFAPVQSLAAKVMGDLGPPAVLVARGADPHDYQLRPSQARLLSGADLAIWVGPQLTPWLARVLDNATTAPRLSLLADPATPRRLFEEGGGTDPHAWLDPEIAAIWVGLIRDALIAADAPNAATYRANADAALADLAALSSELRAILAPVKAPIAVGHDALGYFAARFGLKVAAAVETGDAAQPGLRHLQEVHALLARGEAACLFPETGHDPRREEQLVAGTPARLGQPLDPEGLALDPGPGLYDELLRRLATTIAACARG